MRVRTVFLVVIVTLFFSGVAVRGQDYRQRLGYDDLVRRLYDLELLVRPPVPGEKSGNWSSFDRGAKFNEKTGHYEDWAANADGRGFISKEGDEIVVAQMKGPGVIWRIWSARPEEGHIKFYIDGKEQPVLDIPFKAYFNNKDGMFAYPELVHVKSRGHNSFIPISYQQSCKVVLQGKWGAYYQVTYSTFPEGTAVPSFDGS
ncbi:MAG: hypothetical protein ACYTBV_06365, partial [Planctomycetota bacterium]